MKTNSRTWHRDGGIFVMGGVGGEDETLNSPHVRFTGSRCLLDEVRRATTVRRDSRGQSRFEVVESAEDGTRPRVYLIHARRRMDGGGYGCRGIICGCHGVHVGVSGRYGRQSGR